MKIKMKLYIKEFYKTKEIKISSSLDRRFYWFYQIINNDKYFFKGIELRGENVDDYKLTANWTSNGLNKYIYKTDFVSMVLQQIKECKSHYFYDN